MYLHLQRLMGILMAAIVCQWPMIASAQSQTYPVTVDRAYAQFASAGYQVEPITRWGWTSPSMSTFVVHDPTTERVLMVMVFPTEDIASVFRGRISAHFESEASDPHIISGYGRSAWFSNVGLVQSTESQLAQIAQLQANEENGIYDNPEAASALRAPDIAVDLDFQQALRNSVVNL
jgi:hypothetical protein